MEKSNRIEINSFKQAKTVISIFRYRFRYQKCYLITVVCLAILLVGCATAPKAAVSIVGNWDQYMLVGQDFVYGGTFRVQFDNGEYFMAYSKTREGVTIVTDTYSIEVRYSKGLHDISYKDGIWEFCSDWTSTDTGEFVLFMKSPDLFEGWSYLRGAKRTFNSWRRVK